MSRLLGTVRRDAKTIKIAGSNELLKLSKENIDKLKQTEAIQSTELSEVLGLHPTLAKTVIISRKISYLHPF